nr:uncharacterized protein LOC109158743 [Ipomoea batatas]
MSGKNENSKGKNGGIQGNRNDNFNREGFKNWNNSRYGALENLEEENEDEAQEEYVMMDRPDGPTGAALSGRGKRPQTQVTEAQILNDKSVPRRGNTSEKNSEKNTRDENRSKEGNKKQGNKAAETESHTVVRGYERGNRVVRTMVTEEGNTTEEVQTQPEGGDHHQDPPDPKDLDATSEPGDPMAGVEFTEGQSTGLGVTPEYDLPPPSKVWTLQPGLKHEPSTNTLPTLENRIVDAEIKWGKDIDFEGVETLEHMWCHLLVDSNGWALEAFLISFTLVGEETGWVLAIEVDVTEHRGSTIVCQVIQVLRIRTSKFCESPATLLGGVLRSFALAGDHGVVLKLKVDRACCILNSEQFIHSESRNVDSSAYDSNGNTIGFWIKPLSRKEKTHKISKP